MGLDLNKIVVLYEEFYGRNIDMMPQLVAERRVPLSVAGVMSKRLHSSNADWKDNYSDTGDAFAYHPDGKFKIMLDSQNLLKINPESKLESGALVLEDGVYEKLEGHKFTRKQLKRLIERELTPAKAKAHPIWKELARDDELLSAYVDSMFSEMKQRFNYNKNMGVYLASAEKVPTLRVACIYRLEYRSRLNCRGDLDNDVGRFAV